MTELLIWVNYLIASIFALWRASSIDVRRLTFVDGLLIGMVYYLVLPMLFILIEGQISAQFILSGDYLPFRDHETTLTIIVCLYFIPALHLAVPRPSAPQSLLAAGNRQFDRTLLILVLLSYFASTIISFVLSGLWMGGHWHATAYDVLANNGFALVFRHLANFSRTAILALLLYQAWVGTISRRLFYLLGAAVVLCDLFLTFNRITAAYFLIGIVLLNRDRKWIVAAVLVLLVLVLPFVSNVWPVFRGLATRSGYTLQGLLSAAETSYRTAATYRGIADFTSGVFESINIPVLNYIVRNHDSALSVDPVSIYLRPATIFVPRVVWSDRPEVYGVILGAVINNDSNGLALNSTLIGEPYGNFGAWWPLGMLPMYLIYHFLFLKLSRYSAAFGAVGAFCALAMWRFDSTTAAIALVLSAALLIIVRASLSQRDTPRQVVE